MHGLFLGNTLLKRTYRVKLAHGIHIKRIDTFERFFADSFLMISQEQPPELGPLEEVLSMVLRLGLRQHVDPLSPVVDLGLDEGRLHGDAVSVQKLIINSLFLLSLLGVKIFGSFASMSLN